MSMEGVVVQHIGPASLLYLGKNWTKEFLSWMKPKRRRAQQKMKHPTSGSFEQEMINFKRVCATFFFFCKAPSKLKPWSERWENLQAGSDWEIRWPKKFPNRLHKHQERGPSCHSLPRQTIVQRLEQHWVDKEKGKKKRLGGFGEPTVFRLLFIHPTHFWSCGTRAAVCPPGAPVCATPLRSHCLLATSSR